jgi:hypothetical protein
VDPNGDAAQYPKGFTDNAGNLNLNIFAQGPNDVLSGYNFTSTTDLSMYIAGDSASTDLSTIDNLVYAIPLVLVKRLNNKGYSAADNPHGAIDYVSATITPTPDGAGKYSNVVYKDQVADLRKEAIMGNKQIAAIYAWSLDPIISYMFNTSKYLFDLFIKCLQFISSGQTVTYVIMNMYSKGDVI